MKKEEKTQQDKNEENYILAKRFFKTQKIVHVSLKNNIYWTGSIVDFSESCFFIKDYKRGEQLIFYKELRKPIQEYTPKLTPTNKLKRKENGK